MLVTPIQGSDIALPTIKQGESAAKPTDPVAESKAYYFSPALVIDPKTGTDVLEYRNSSTGDVINQFPSERDLKAYRQNSLRQDSTQSGNAGGDAIGTFPASSVSVATAPTKDAAAIDKQAQAPTTAEAAQPAKTTAILA